MQSDLCSLLPALICTFFFWPFGVLLSLPTKCLLGSADPQWHIECFNVLSDSRFFALFYPVKGMTSNNALSHGVQTRVYQKFCVFRNTVRHFFIFKCPLPMRFNKNLLLSICANCSTVNWRLKHVCARARARLICVLQYASDDLTAHFGCFVVHCNVYVLWFWSIPNALCVLD